jgi:arsenite methyltransferase
MELIISEDESKNIKESIRRKYAQVAVSPQGQFRYPTGRAGLEALRYDPEMIGSLPEKAVLSFCGVGNPFSLGPIREGEAVLDIGCGGGLDSLVAAVLVGPRGRVVGIDLSSDMIARAREHLREAGLDPVDFQEGGGETLPFPDESFDVVLSNGVFNLLPDKPSALREAWRVLKKGGRLMMADQVLTGSLPEDRKARLDSWFR